jgi:hypothetical protein
MSMEHWLEEAMVATNKLLRLVPASFLEGCIGECHKKGVQLQTIASTSHQLGLANIDKLAVWKEAIPHPNQMLSDQPEVSAFKNEYELSIERCRFLSCYLIGMTKEIPVDLDWQPDEGVAGALGGIVGGLVGKSTAIKEQEQEERHGDSHSNPT